MALRQAQRDERIEVTWKKRTRGERGRKQKEKKNLKRTKWKPEKKNEKCAFASAIVKTYKEVMMKIIVKTKEKKNKKWKKQENCNGKKFIRCAYREKRDILMKSTEHIVSIQSQAISLIKCEE